MYPSFETARLILKPTTEEDAMFLVELFNTPKWIQFIGDRNVRTEDQAKDYIKTKITAQFERLGYSNYVIIKKSDNTKIGTCGLNDREGIDGIDIGFALLPEYENLGYAFEAAKKVLAAAFDVFSLTTISAITIPGNTSSRKLLEKLGLEYKRMIRIPNDAEDLMLYVLNKNQNACLPQAGKL